MKCTVLLRVGMWRGPHCGERAGMALVTTNAQELQTGELPELHVTLLGIFAELRGGNPFNANLATLSGPICSIHTLLG